MPKSLEKLLVFPISCSKVQILPRFSKKLHGHASSRPQLLEALHNISLWKVKVCHGEMKSNFFFSPKLEDHNWQITSSSPDPIIVLGVCDRPQLYSWSGEAPCRERQWRHPWGHLETTLHSLDTGPARAAGAREGGKGTAAHWLSVYILGVIYIKI